jgi:hypothetical protein
MKIWLRSNLVLIAILVIAVGLRLAYILFFGNTLHLQMSGYDVYIVNILNGHGYTRFADFHPDSDLPPLYSFFLVGAYLLLLLGFFDVWSGWRFHKQIGPLLIVLIAITVAYLIYHPSTRYRSPADPFLFILAGYAVVWLWERREYLYQHQQKRVGQVAHENYVDTQDSGHSVSDPYFTRRKFAPGQGANTASNANTTHTASAANTDRRG